MDEHLKLSTFICCIPRAVPEMIGLHLLVDGVTRTEIDSCLVKEILSSLPGRIGMKILLGPSIVKGDPANPGWTGFVIIDKSHIVIHTFSENNTISVDVYSCKPFNAKEVVMFLQEKINFEEITTRTITREIL